MKKIYPKIPNYYSTIELDENKIVFHSSEQNILVEDNEGLIKKLIPYFNGRYSIDKISENTKIKKEYIEKVVNLLKKKQLVRILNKKIEDSEEENNVFFERYFSNSKEIEEKLSKSKITLISIGKIGAYILSDLSKFKFKEINTIDLNKNNHTDIEKEIKNIEVPDLVIFCSDGRNTKLHHKLNELLIKQNIKWISVRYKDIEGEIGPYIIPGETACFNCYDYRFKSNIDYLKEWEVIENYFNNKEEKVNELFIFRELLSKYTLIEIMKILTNYTQPLTINNIFSVNFKTCQNNIYPILKLPNCPICMIKRWY